MKAIQVILRYVILFSIMFAWFGMDYYFYDIISARGGWDAWVSTNPFWQTAIMMAVMWNIFGAVCMLICWITRND